MKYASISSAIFTIALTLAVSACGSSNPDRAADTTTSASTVTVGQRSTTTTTVKRPSLVVDKAVRIESGRLHIHCDGSGASTVLLIAGWDNGGDESWSPVQPALAKRTRVCTYDRFGTGTSDAATTPQTFATQAAALHALLVKADEPGPYVVVGHSFGGAEAVDFASRYRTEVVGLMLVDASPPTWPAALCAVPNDGTQTGRDYQTTCGIFHHPERDAERLDAFPAFHDVATITTLDDLPMTIMTAAKRTLPGLAASELVRLTNIWNKGLAHWAALSTASTVVTVKNTGHHIQGEHPAIVINEVSKLIPLITEIQEGRAR